MAYYPLNRITPGLFTSGNEFKCRETNEDYRGYYFSAYDGKFFTEKTPTDFSAELVRYGSGGKSSPTLSSRVYTNSTSISTTTSATNHYMPTPADTDYTKGYITRYFIKRVNGDGSTIKELSLENYSKIQKDPLYSTLALTWKISGKLEDTPLANGMSLPGVVSFNSKIISMAEGSMPGISTYLVDPSQFYK